VDVFGVPSGLLLVYGVSRNSISLVTLSVNCYVYRLLTNNGIQSFMFALLN